MLPVLLLILWDENYYFSNNLFMTYTEWNITTIFFVVIMHKLGYFIMRIYLISVITFRKDRKFAMIKFGIDETDS